MSSEEAVRSLAILLGHEDPDVRKHAENILASAEQDKQFYMRLAAKTDQMKMDVQYICFDLEATRRERDALKGTS
jgi:hypothetical protein